jgi:hypothetical protein
MISLCLTKLRPHVLNRAKGISRREPGWELAGSLVRRCEGCMSASEKNKRKSPPRCGQKNQTNLPEIVTRAESNENVRAEGSECAETQRKSISSIPVQMREGNPAAARPPAATQDHYF